MVNTGDVFDGYVNKSVAFNVAQTLHQKFKRSTLKGGELLITLVGANFGRVAIAPQEYCGFNCSRAVGVVPVIEDVKYVMFALRSPIARFFMDNRANTTAQPTFNLKDVAELPIPVAPKKERETISEFLCALDDRITLLRETNTTLEAIAQALFKSWFVDFDPVRAKQEGREPEGMDADTAALFPDSFEESELGLVPMGWRIGNFVDFITRLSVGKKYDNKSALPEGNVPILDQGKSGIIGFHNDPPSVKASLDAPIVVFANHTCYMRLISYDFSAIQNVLPFVGKDVDTVWAYYATKDRVKFSEYKGHWPDFAIEKAVIPNGTTTIAFRETADPLIRRIRFNELQAQTLATLRDTLLPRLISGRLRLPDAEALVEEGVA